MRGKSGQWAGLIPGMSRGEDLYMPKPEVKTGRILHLWTLVFYGKINSMKFCVIRGGDYGKRSCFKEFYRAGD